MIVRNNNNAVGVLSQSPHSLGLSTELTVPSWGDSNKFVVNQKLWNSHGFQGLGMLGMLGNYGLGKCSGNSNDIGSCGCGCNGTSGLGIIDFSSWGTKEWLIAGGAIIALTALHV